MRKLERQLERVQAKVVEQRDLISQLKTDCGQLHRLKVCSCCCCCYWHTHFPSGVTYYTFCIEHHASCIKCVCVCPQDYSQQLEQEQASLVAKKEQLELNLSRQSQQLSEARQKVKQKQTQGSKELEELRTDLGSSQEERDRLKEEGVKVRMVLHNSDAHAPCTHAQEYAFIIITSDAM